MVLVFLTISVPIIGCAQESSWNTDIEKAWALYQAEKYETAESLLVALANKDEKAGGNADHRLVDHMLLGELYETTGYYKRSLTQRKQGLDIVPNSTNTSFAMLLRWLVLVGRSHLLLGELRPADSLLRAALVICNNLLDEDSEGMESTLTMLAYLRTAQAKYAAAESLYTRLRSIRIGLYGSDDVSIAEVDGNLGSVAARLGQYTRADSLIRHALRKFEKEYGVESDVASAGLNNLGEVYRFQGKFSQAESLYQRSRDIKVAVLPRDHPDVACAFSNLAELYCDWGKFEEAEPLAKQARDSWSKVPGPDFYLNAWAVASLGRIETEQGNYAEADSLLSHGLELIQASTGPAHPDVAKILDYIAALQLAQDDRRGADTTLGRALTIREQFFPTDHPEVLDTRRRYTELLRMMGNANE